MIFAICINVKLLLRSLSILSFYSQTIPVTSNMLTIFVVGLCHAIYLILLVKFLFKTTHFFKDLCYGKKAYSTKKNSIDIYQDIIFGI